MKVKIKDGELQRKNQKPVRAGETVELDDKEAAWLISIGKAEKVTGGNYAPAAAAQPELGGKDKK